MKVIVAFISIAFVFLGSSPVSADDGVFYALGNTLIPIHESTISLKKEILKLKKDKDYLDVDVYFEFDNPGKSRKETVGFVTPPGGYSDEKSTKLYVSGFAVTVNNENLSYKLSRFEETGFKLPKRSREAANSGDFIFYFPAKFVHGLNSVHHSYRIRSGEGQSDLNEYIYRLVTGKSWANNEMEDFTLIIDMGPDSYFYLPQTFWKTGEDIPWKIEGDGFISRTCISAEGLQRDSMTIRMVKMHHGTVTCHMMHFKPDYDLGFGVPRFWNMSWWASSWMKDSSTATPTCFANADLVSTDSTSFVGFSDHELVALLNLPFAFHDCRFNSEELNKYFSQFNWYLPYPNRSPDMKLLSKDEGDLIHAVEQEEHRRQKR